MIFTPEATRFARASAEAPHEHRRTSGIADLSPVDRLQQQRAWNWYDWAN